MRVLHITTDFPFVLDGEMNSYGGLGLCALQMIEGLKKKGVNIDVLTRGGFRIDGELITNVVRVPYISLSDSRDWKLTHSFTMLPSFISMVGRNKYDIVHAHNPPAALFTVPIARLMGIKTIMTMHGPWAFVRDRFRFLAKIIERVCLMCADCVMFDSYALRRMYYADKKYVAVQNAVDASVFSPKELKGCMEMFGFDDVRMVFLYVGRVVFGKELGVIFEAARKCKWADFIIVGSDSISGVEIPNNVRFMGFVPNSLMPNLYGACDAVILPTKAEGMSRSLLEAMSCGVAAFASNIPANMELFKSSELLFSSADDLIERLKKYSRVELQQFGIANRKHITLHFNIEDRIEKIFRHYKNMLGEKS